MNSKDIIISIATLDQVLQLNQLIQYFAKELSRGFYTEIETNAAIDYVLGVDTTLIKDQTYFTASIRGELVGCGDWSHRSNLYGGDQRPVDQVQQVQQAQQSKESHNLETNKNTKAILPATHTADSANTAHAAHAVRIRAFFVSPQFSRQGVAYALFDAC